MMVKWLLNETCFKNCKGIHSTEKTKLYNDLINISAYDFGSKSKSPYKLKYIWSQYLCAIFINIYFVLVVQPYNFVNHYIMKYIIFHNEK